jgi:hypothetical protein
MLYQVLVKLFYVRLGKVISGKDRLIQVNSFYIRFGQFKSVYVRFGQVNSC